MSKSMEDALKKSLYDITRYKFKVKLEQVEQAEQLSITSRRLIVAFHNGWRLVNRKGMNNFVKLDDVSKDEYEK